MNKNSFLQCEEERLKKFKNYQLPHHFKKIGVAITVLGLLALLINKFTLEQNALKIAAKYGMLLGLLIVSISKEKLEDELIINLRMQSFSVAFICGVAFALILPATGFLIDYFFELREPQFKNIGDFSILWMLLSIQVFYFELLKRIR